MFINSTRRPMVNARQSIQGAKASQSTDQSIPSQREDVRVPFKEQMVTSAIVGASLGTMAGEKIGGIGFVGGASYLGYAIGNSLGQGEIGGLIGGVVGAGLGYFTESKFSIGKTVGGLTGFVSGGLVGGITGTVIAGATSLF